MLTRIQHFAIVSENFVREARFFEAAFGMKRSKPGSEEEQKAIRTNYAVSIGDGYVGVTMIGRKPGYRSNSSQPFQRFQVLGGYGTHQRSWNIWNNWNLWN